MITEQGALPLHHRSGRSEWKDETWLTRIVSSEIELSPKFSSLLNEGLNQVVALFRSRRVVVATLVSAIGFRLKEDSDSKRIPSIKARW